MPDCYIAYFWVMYVLLYVHTATLLSLCLVTWSIATFRNIILNMLKSIKLSLPLSTLYFLYALFCLLLFLSFVNILDLSLLKLKDSIINHGDMLVNLVIWVLLVFSIALLLLMCLYVFFCCMSVWVLYTSTHTL